MKIARFEKDYWDGFFEELFLEDFSKDLWPEAQRYDFVLCTFDDAKMIGYLTIEVVKQDAFLCFGAIDPSFRGKGLAKESLLLAFAYLSKMFKSVSLAARKDNADMNALAKRLKFLNYKESVRNGDSHNEYFLRL